MSFYFAFGKFFSGRKNHGEVRNNKISNQIPNMGGGFLAAFNFYFPTDGRKGQNAEKRKNFIYFVERKTYHVGGYAM